MKQPPYGKNLEAIMVLQEGLIMCRARSDRRSHPTRINAVAPRQRRQDLVFSCSRDPRGPLRLLHFSLVFLLTVLALGSPVLADDCETIGGNQVTSCGFESPGEVAAWSDTAGTLAFAAGLGETGNGAVGTAEDFGSLWVVGSYSPCFPATPGQEFDLGYWVQLFSGIVPDRCTAGWAQYSDLSCSGGNGGSIGVDQFVPGAAYIEVTGSHIVGAGTAGMQLIVDCRSTAGAFEVLFDNGYAKDAAYLFADGFEPGDTSAWSSTVP